MELAHLPYKKGRTYEDYVGLKGFKRLGVRRWRKQVGMVLQIWRAALQPDYIVVGGGNAERLTQLPTDVRLGDNANAFKGGFRLWRSAPAVSTRGKRQPKKAA
jgi:polyphosphate glucokinase